MGRQNIAWDKPFRERIPGTLNGDGRYRGHYFYAETRKSRDGKWRAVVFIADDTLGLKLQAPTLAAVKSAIRSTVKEEVNARAEEVGMIHVPTLADVTDPMQALEAIHAEVCSE